MIIPQKANSCNRGKYKKALKQFGLFQGLSAYSTSLALGGQAEVLQLVQGQEEQRIQQLQDLHQERHLRGEQVAFPLKLPCPQDLAHALAAAAPDCHYYRGMAVREPIHRVVSFYLFLWHHVFLLCFLSDSGVDGGGGGTGLSSAGVSFGTGGETASDLGSAAAGFLTSAFGSGVS